MAVAGIFAFIILMVVLYTFGYFMGYTSGQMRYIRARIRTLDSMSALLDADTDAHTAEWYRGALWCIEESTPETKLNKKETNNVRD